SLEEAGAALLDMANALLLEDPARQQIIVPARAKDVTRSHIEEAADGLVILDERATIAGYDAAAERIFGLSEKEVVGKEASVLFVVADDGAAPVSVRTGRGGALVLDVRADVLGRRRGGITLPLDVSVSTIAVDGQRRFVLRVRDLEEQRRREEP